MKIERMKKIDYMFLGIIVLVYSFFSFINLGRSYNPKTYYNLNKGDSIIYKVYDTLLKINYFNGECGSDIKIYTSLDGVSYLEVFDSVNDNNYSFAWVSAKIGSNAKYIKILALEDSSFGEIKLYGVNNYDVKYEILGGEIEQLHDEEEMVDDYNYMSSTYFDEIYFARSSYDILNGLNVYEWTHPPIGKLIQAIPVLITSNFSPFTYRFMGNVAGIVMIIFLYLFAKMLFKKTSLCVVASLLVCFDTFHFAQTRIGTVDSFLVLFMIISIYSMMRYMIENNYKYLVVSSIFFSLSIGVKWSGLYSSLVLFVIYLYSLFKNKTNIWKFLINGFLLFILVPVIIYIFSYLIYPNYSVIKTNNLKNIWELQKMMFSYHSALKETHPYSSLFYTWPISYKPVFMYSSSYLLRGVIVGIGNIVIWWSGILAFLLLIYKSIKKDKIAVLIVIPIILLYLPYMFISRVMFLYHYFIILPYVYLGVVYLIDKINSRFKNNYFIYLFMFFVILFFIIYYPVVSGMPIEESRINSLRLFESWVF